MRGKEAASAHRKNFIAAQMRATTLLQEAIERDEAHRAEINRLKNELTKLQSKTMADIAAAAEQRVQDVEQRLVREVADIRAKHHQQVLDAGDLLRETKVAFPFEVWDKYCQIFQVQYGELFLARGGGPREKRRARTAALRKIHCE